MNTAVKSIRTKKFKESFMDVGEGMTRQRRWQLRKLADGLCERCGGKKNKPEIGLCELCRAKMKDYYYTKRVKK